MESAEGTTPAPEARNNSNPVRPLAKREQSRVYSNYAERHEGLEPKATQRERSAVRGENTAIELCVPKVHHQRRRRATSVTPYERRAVGS